MIISRAVTPRTPGADARPAPVGVVGAVARSVGMVALAVFGILVLLPAALAAQAALAF